jgi:putative ABC transport system permease protein
MFSYYVALALRSFRRRLALSSLLIATSGLGIGCCVTALAMHRALAGDPVPGKSEHLYYVQADLGQATPGAAGGERPGTLMTYVDAMAIAGGRKDLHQASVALTPARIASASASASASPSSPPMYLDGVMTTSSFFSMFDVPFDQGRPWSAEEDRSGANVVVISRAVNDRLFGGGRSVGRSLRVNDISFTVVGVLREWSPQPRFYAVDLSRQNYGQSAGVFIPLRSGLDASMKPEVISCYGPADVSKLDTAPCTFLGMWVELDNPSDVADYRSYLSNYANQFATAGGAARSRILLTPLKQWLINESVVPDNVRLQVIVAFGFLFICVVNCSGLLLAKQLSRQHEVGVRRALGASRASVFYQFLVESLLFGLLGSVVGAALAWLGILGIKRQPTPYASLAHLAPADLLTAFLLSVAASAVAGVLPAWRASVAPPSIAIKLQ